MRKPSGGSRNLTLWLGVVRQNGLHQKHGVSFSQISRVQRSSRGAQPPFAVSTKPSSEEEEEMKEEERG